MYFLFHVVFFSQGFHLLIISSILLVNATNHGQHIFISKNGADEKKSEKTIGEILRGEWIDGTSVEGSIAIGVITDNAADVFTFDFR